MWEVSVGKNATFCSAYFLTNFARDWTFS